MSLLSSRWLRWVGYVCFALVMFVICFYATFPYERIKQLIEGHAAASGNMSLSIGELGPKFLVGLNAEDVVIRTRPSPRPGRSRPVMPAAGGDVDAKEEAAPKTERFVIEQVGATVGVFRWLFGGGIAVDFAADCFGGAIDGAYSVDSKKAATLTLEADELSLSQVPVLARAIGLPLKGSLSLNSQLEIPARRRMQVTGSVNLDCESCTIGDGKAKLKIPGIFSEGLSLPPIKLGEMTGRIEIKKGAAQFETLSLRGGDVEAEIEGTLNLRAPVRYSAVDSYVRFRVAPEFKEKTKTIPFDLLEGQLARGKRSDGFYGLHITGMLQRPRTQLTATAPTR